MCLYLPNSSQSDGCCSVAKAKLNLRVTKLYMCLNISKFGSGVKNSHHTQSASSQRRPTATSP